MLNNNIRQKNQITVSDFSSYFKIMLRNEGNAKMYITDLPPEKLKTQQSDPSIHPSDNQGCDKKNQSNEDY